VEKLVKLKVAPTLRGWKRLLPVLVRRTSEGWSLRIYWGKAVIALPVLLILGWISAAGLVYGFVRYHRQLEGMHWWDIAYPPRWDHFRLSQGQAYLARAQSEMNAGRYGEAFHYLRVGLAKAPADREGRLLLAQFQELAGRADLVERTLLDGLPHLDGDEDYLAAILVYLLHRQRDDVLVRLADERLAGEERTPSLTRRLALAAATASYHRGHYDRAEDYLRRYGLSTQRDARVLEARMTWERGYQDLALLQIQRLHDELGHDAEIYSTYVQWLRELGRETAARHLSLMRRLQFPGDAQARIDLLYAHDRAGEQMRVVALTREILADFADQPQVLLAVADFGANTGRADITRQVLDRLHTAGEPIQGAALMTIEAHIVAGRHQEALAHCRQLAEEFPALSERYHTVFNGLQAIAFFGLDDRESGQLFLNTFLNQPNLRAENLLAVSRRLTRVHAHPQARQVLAHAARIDPLNQAVLQSLIELDLEAGRPDALPELLRQLLTVRKPSRELLHRAYRSLASDRLILRPAIATALDELAAHLQQPTT
jgi:hypothetical protein